MCKDVIVRFGGHPRAAGFTVLHTQWDEFVQRMEDLARKAFVAHPVSSQILIDARLSLDDITWDLWKDLEALAPYGEGNREPRFLLSALTVQEVNGLGKDSQHLRILVKSSEGKTRKLIGFSFGNIEKMGTNWCERLIPDTKIDVVVEVGVNQWNGNQELQLKMVDLRLSI